MKNSLRILWAFIILPEITFASGELLSNEIIDTPSMYQKYSSSRGRNSLIPSAHYDVINKRFERLMGTIEELFPRPVNAMVHTWGGIDESYTYPLVGTEFRNSPYQLDLHMSFHDILGWNDDDPVPEVEASYGIRLQFNSIWTILQEKPVQYGNNRVFRTPVKGTNVEQYPRYNGWIVMSLPGKKLPWRPATRQEYLENAILKLNFNKHLSEKSLAYQHSNMAKKMLNEMTEAERLFPAYLEKKDKKVIEYFMPEWRGFSKAGDANVEALVIKDEKFFDDKMPKTSIQLIAIGGMAGDYGEKKKEQIKRINAMILAPGVLGSIYAMLFK